MSQIVVAGSFVQDLAFRTPTFPAPGETRIGSFMTGPGGKGFNQAVAANRLGAETLFVGAVGDDVFGRGVVEFARGEALRTELEVLSGVPSGAASVVINQRAENMIVVALGANEGLSAQFVKAQAEEIAQAKVLVCQLECSLLAMETALKLGRSKGTVTLLNPAPINPDVTAAQVALADILVPNETEFAFLINHFVDRTVAADPKGMSEEELHYLCRRLGNASVVVTLGDRGAFVSHSEPAPIWAKQDKRAHYCVPAIAVRPIDTTGAGDAFCGGLAAGMLRSPENFETAVVFANTVAGLSTEGHGTAPSMPRKNDVENRMRGK